MAFVALCLWVVLAWGLQSVLTARQSWPAAYGLMALLVPLLIWLGAEAGAIGVLAGLAVAALVLRWPLRYGLRWLRRRITG